MPNLAFAHACGGGDACHGLPAAPTGAAMMHVDAAAAAAAPAAQQQQHSHAATLAPDGTIIPAGGSKEWQYRLVTFPSYFTPCPACCGANRTPKREQLVTHFDTDYPTRVYCSHCPEHKTRTAGLLQVRRSAFKDVVKAADLARFHAADVAGVQQYTLNGSKVLYLNREQAGEKKGSGSSAAPATCIVDGRAMMDRASLYCSLKCKMQGEDAAFREWQAQQQQGPSAARAAAAAALAACAPPPPRPTAASSKRAAADGVGGASAGASSSAASCGGGAAASAAPAPATAAPATSSAAAPPRAKKSARSDAHASPGQAPTKPRTSFSGSSASPSSNKASPKQQRNGGASSAAALVAGAPPGLRPIRTQLPSHLLKAASLPLPPPSGADGGGAAGALLSRHGSLDGAAATAKPAALLPADDWRTTASPSFAALGRGLLPDDACAAAGAGSPAGAASGGSTGSEWWLATGSPTAGGGGAPFGGSAAAHELLTSDAMDSEGSEPGLLLGWTAAAAAAATAAMVAAAPCANGGANDWLLPSPAGALFGGGGAGADADMAAPELLA